MNNSFYQVIPYEKPYFKKQKKRPHKSGAGWLGTLFLNQILKKCNPLSVAQHKCISYTTDSASMIFLYVYLKTLIKFFNLKVYE